MVVSTQELDEQDLVRMIRSRYLRDERRYDAWGAQGKVLAIYETLQAEGYDLSQMTDKGVAIQRLANLVFPRCFDTDQLQHLPPSIRESIVAYYHELRCSLTAQQLLDDQADFTALRETAARFGLSISQVEEILSPR